MSQDSSTTWYHSNRYSSQSACEHCQGVIRHESWCIKRKPAVLYAYEIAGDESKLTIGDALILHALGVSWVKKPGRKELFQPAHVISLRTPGEGI